MAKSTTLTLEHRRALIEAKAEMARRLPEPKDDKLPFKDFLRSECWRFEEEQYDNDEEYREQMNRDYHERYLCELEQRQAFNELLDDLFSVLS